MTSVLFQKLGEENDIVLCSQVLVSAKKRKRVLTLVKRSLGEKIIAIFGTEEIPSI